MFVVFLYIYKNTKVVRGKWIKISLKKLILERTSTFARGQYIKVLLDKFWLSRKIMIKVINELLLISISYYLVVYFYFCFSFVFIFIWWCSWSFWYVWDVGLLLLRFFLQMSLFQQHDDERDKKWLRKQREKEKKEIKKKIII